MGIKLGFVANDFFIGGFNKLLAEGYFDPQTHLKIHKFSKQLNDNLEIMKPKINELFTKKANGEISEEEHLSNLNELNNCETELALELDYKHIEKLELTRPQFNALQTILVNRPPEIEEMFKNLQ